MPANPRDPFDPSVTGGRAPFGFSRVVFLSHVLDPATPVFPGDPPVEITPVMTVGDDGYLLRRVSFGEQSGTHFAAPAHFRDGAATADQLDPADFFLPAVVLDVRERAGADPDYAATPDDARRWEAAHGPIPAGAAVLLRTGRDELWPTPAYAARYPGFSAAAASWLVTERAVAALGTDTMGVDASADTGYSANRVLLDGHRIHLENLCRLGELPPRGAWIVVGAPRLAGGSGAPATVFGLIP